MLKVKGNRLLASPLSNPTSLLFEVTRSATSYRSGGFWRGFGTLSHGVNLKLFKDDNAVPPSGSKEVFKRVRTVVRLKPVPAHRALCESGSLGAE